MWGKASTQLWEGFLGSSVGKESACNAGSPYSIPASGSSPEKGIGYPLLYSWASQVDQTVKNPPAMQDTWVQSLGGEDPLEEGMTTHSRGSSNLRDGTQVSCIAGGFFTI